MCQTLRCPHAIRCTERPSIHMHDYCLPMHEQSAPESVPQLTKTNADAGQRLGSLFARVVGGVYLPPRTSGEKQGGGLTGSSMIGKLGRSKLGAAIGAIIVSTFEVRRMTVARGLESGAELQRCGRGRAEGTLGMPRRPPLALLISAE